MPFVRCLLLSLCFIAAAAAQEDPGRADTDVRFDFGVTIPVADGTELGATLYRPADSGEEKLPTIVTITPYISDRYHPDAQYFARSGFAFLVVDTRGRGNSGGDFRPLGIEDGTDGHDVVEWIAEQPWSNGKIGMRGGSYGGYNQWVTARYFPEHLTTIVPIASPHHGIDFPMNYNVQYPYSIRWLTLTSGVTPQGRTFGDNAFWNRKFREYHTQGIAFADLDTHVGTPSKQFDEWVAHPMQDDYWAARVPSQEEYGRFDLPILTITGYYDGDQPGAMEYYQRHMRYGTDAGKAHHYLILGPWNHSGTRFPVQEFGGLRFGDAMMFDAFALDRDWYRWTMGEGDRPDFILDRVTYFVAGANTWKGAPSLQAIATGERVLHLQSSTGAESLFQSGSMLDDAPAEADVDSYVYDPLDTSKVMDDPADAYILDQTELVATSGDGLIYHSDPFEAPTEITGYARFEAWLEMDVPDTDVNVTLYEVLADGTSIALAGETKRMRFRRSLAEETFMTPGKVEPVVFEHFYFFSRQIAAGSRLRLFIRPGNGLAQQRNYNSGGVVAEETRADAQTAVVRLHLGPDTPTRLILPIVEGGDG
ncbi:MAG: CocE/NonD family hydrolase [Pseudomonadota bacterium]